MTEQQAIKEVRKELAHSGKNKMIHVTMTKEAAVILLRMATNGERKP